MTQSARDLENTFAHAWTLLVRNPVIIVPGIVLAAVGAGLEYALRAWISDDLTYAIVLIVLAFALGLVQMAYVTGMAGAAWRDERARLHDGLIAFEHRGAAVGGAWLLLVVIGFCAAVLAGATFGVTLIAFAVFFIYTMAAVVIGDRRPVKAITESAGLALRNVMPTIGVVGLIVVIAAAGGWLGALAGRFSDPAGWLVSGVLQQVIVAYATLVVAGEYLKLTTPPTSS